MHHTLLRITVTADMWRFTLHFWYDRHQFGARLLHDRGIRLIVAAPIRFN